MIKRFLSLGTVFLLVLSLAACGNADSGSIYVISREDGSGTRGAFVELLKIEEKDENGEKVDLTTPYAEVTNNTAVMITSVMSDSASIGYISLGSLSDVVKPIQIDGIPPTVESVKDGSYPLSRPFMIAVREDLTPQAEDFIRFIISRDGQVVVQDKGYAPLDSDADFTSGKVSGKVVVSGSSSVTPVMEALKEAYLLKNPDAQIEIQQNDSTTGANSAIEGICDIAMISRDLKESEQQRGLSSIQIAADGIVIIVNNQNTIENLSAEQVKDIYIGKTTLWSEVKGN